MWKHRKNFPHISKKKGFRLPRQPYPVISASVITAYFCLPLSVEIFVSFSSRISRDTFAWVTWNPSFSRYADNSSCVSTSFLWINSSIFACRVVEIKMGSRRFQKDETACVSFDGDTPEHLHVGDRVRIAQAQSTIWICKISNLKPFFFEICGQFFLCFNIFSLNQFEYLCL